MLRSITAMLLTLGMAIPSFAMDREYYSIKDVQVTDVTEITNQAEIFSKYNGFGLNQDCNSNSKVLPKYSGDSLIDDLKSGLNVLDTIEVIVDKIINIGKKIFVVVEAGKPVVNLKLDTANALPQGLTCWSDLSGWQFPQSKVYNVKYKNAYGMTVVDYTYRVTYTAGGSVDGIGKYITNATFQPANIYVAWGFEFDASAVIPSVFNTGSRQDPVAGMQMNMQWKVTSPLAHAQSTETYFVSGENKLVELD